MKVAATTLLLAAAVAVPAARAFAPAAASVSVRPSAVAPLQGASRPDSADAIAEAMRMCKEFGATSKEARVAWDIVEEMDASNNSAAIAPVSTMTPSESRKIDYLIEINGLACLIEETSDALLKMRSAALQLRSLEISDPSLSKIGPESGGLKTALTNAKAAIEVHGPGSAQADAAWSNLETCAETDKECFVDAESSQALGSADRYSAAALKAHHYYDAVVDPELLSEAMDAFDSIEALGQFVKVEKNRLNKL